jgi:hypothetical protein
LACVTVQFAIIFDNRQPSERKAIVKRQTVKQHSLQFDTNANVLAKTGDNYRAIAVSNDVSKQRLQKLAVLDFEISEAVLIIYHKQLIESKEDIHRHKHTPLVVVTKVHTHTHTHTHHIHFYTQRKRE